MGSQGRRWISSVRLSFSGDGPPHGGLASPPCDLCLQSQVARDSVGERLDQKVMAIPNRNNFKSVLKLLDTNDLSYFYIRSSKITCMCHSSTSDPAPILHLETGADDSIKSGMN